MNHVVFVAMRAKEEEVAAAWKENDKLKAQTKYVTCCIIEFISFIHNVFVVI
jgi:hypothetical protein